MKKDAKPYHTKAYPEPNIHQPAIKKEVDRFI